MIPGGIIFALYWIVSSILSGTTVVDRVVGAVLGLAVSGVGYGVLQLVREWEQHAEQYGHVEDDRLK